MSKTKETSCNFGIITIPLTLLFIILKLVGIIAWSWWWVTSPLWIPIAVVIICGLLMWITLTILAILSVFFD